MQWRKGAQPLQYWYTFEKNKKQRYNYAVEMKIQLKAVNICLNCTRDIMGIAAGVILTGLK